MSQHPADPIARANEQSDLLRILIRAPEILVMPGAYDPLSAKLFEHLGFKAIQGSSAAVAAVLGYQDGERLSREQFIEATRRMVEAVRVPFNADGEKGYGDAEGIRGTVRGLVLAGAAGMNLEDSAHEVPGRPWGLVPVEEQLRKIAALQNEVKEMGSHFFLNARVDTLLTMRDNPEAALEEGIRRGRAYAEAGADCIFFIGATMAEIIGELVRGIPAPVSVLAGPRSPSVAELERLGVARVSYGGLFGNVAIAAVRRLALEIMERGTITSAEGAMTRKELYAFLYY